MSKKRGTTQPLFFFVCRDFSIAQPFFLESRQNVGKSVGIWGIISGVGGDRISHIKRFVKWQRIPLISIQS
jgi:hypothetical protein